MCDFYLARYCGPVVNPRPNTGDVLRLLVTCCALLGQFHLALSLRTT